MIAMGGRIARRSGRCGRIWGWWDGLLFLRCCLPLWRFVEFVWVVVVVVDGVGRAEIFVDFLVVQTRVTCSRSWMAGVSLVANGVFLFVAL